MKEENRIKIIKKEQIRLFKKFKEELGRRKKASKYLSVKEGTYAGYAYARIRYLPKNILHKICNKLKINLPRILDSKTLREIRQNTIKRTYPVLRKKYGKDWLMIIARKGHKSLERIYGENWRKIIARRGHKTSIKKYGKKFQKIIWQKALSSLKERYGENYNYKLYKLANLASKHPLTIQEKEVCEQLKDNNILFETHYVKDNKEFDIMIPNSKKPEIIIECSNSKPSMELERLKILQLIEQKEMFPKSVPLLILNKGNKKNKFSEQNYNFLINEEIKVFWEDEISIMIKMLRDYLQNKNKKLLDFRYKDLSSINNEMLIKRLSKRKFNKDELKLHKLLLEIDAKPQGSRIIETDYKNILIPDNYEELYPIKIAYEITNAKNYHALYYLAGKIVYLKKVIKNLKTVVILTNKEKLNNRKEEKSLLKYSDVVLLKNQFNREGLINARNQILSKLKS